MEYKYTYYEIIETIPSILKSRIPLIYIIRLSLYIPSLFLLYLKGLFKGDFSFKNILSKTESYLGKEENKYIEKDLDEIEREVLRTESFYFNENDSKEILKNLIKEGYEIDLDQLSFPFRLKTRVEFIKNATEDKIFIVKSYPKIAKTIKKIIKDPYESKTI